MAKPVRNARPDKIVSSARTFFATTKTSQGLPLLHSERNATLMVAVLRSNVAGKFMPDPPEKYPSCFAYLARQKAQRLKPNDG